jgi:hypothetical protein
MTFSTIGDMAVNLKKQLVAEFSSSGIWFLFSPRQDRRFEGPHNKPQPPLELWTTSARIAEKATGDSRMLPQLNYKRAVVTFLLAYIVVTILAIALSVGIGMALHLPPTAEPMQNQAYLISERFLPLLNLAVWGLFAWVYLRQRTTVSDQRLGTKQSPWEPSGWPPQSPWTTSSSS